jgi:branched-chain amino acid aminotransferase
MDQTLQPAAANEPVVYVNGAFVPQSQARISVLDHAVLYGDGIFETVFAWKRRIFKLEEHLDRAWRSMRAIALEPPMPRADMRALIVEAAARNGYEDAYIKWIVTRGVNGKPLMDPTGCVPNLIILVQPYLRRASEDKLRRGLALKTVAWRRPAGDVLDAQIKSLNYLNLVLAKIEAKAAGAEEALLLDAHGRLCEAAGWNILLRHGKRLRTPRHDILFGITRETVMEIAPQAGLVASEDDLTLYDAYTADEMLLCSTAGGVLPVSSIDGRPVGEGRPGPGFEALHRAYDALISSPTHGTPFGDAVAPTT